MARLLPALVVVVALGASGCGKSKQAEALERVKALCLGFPAARASLNAIDQQFQQHGFFGGCAIDFQPAGVQGCAFDGVTTFCKVLWVFPATDRALCSPFGCNAYCEAWTQAAGGLTGDEVVCGTRFSQGQP